jgi:hypothetical protein
MSQKPRPLVLLEAAEKLAWNDDDDKEAAN